MSIKFENTEVVGWEAVIRGMRNPMNSWEKSDSGIGCDNTFCRNCTFNQQWCGNTPISIIGSNDHSLMMRLRNAGTDHRKYMRMIVVYVDITAPLYWWKEFDTYKVGTVANSCSTMHKIADKEFTLEDFSCEHLSKRSMFNLIGIVKDLNYWREAYLKFKDDNMLFDVNGKPRFDVTGKRNSNDSQPAYYTDEHEYLTKKDIWWQMIQLLPSSYNQRRTVMLNYEVLANIYKSRKNHKLDEWAEHVHIIQDSNTEKMYRIPIQIKKRGFCDWIKTLPYSELITGRGE